MKYFYLFLLILITGFSKPTTGQVKVYQESLELPTYGVEDPEMMPDWRQYRYPYTMYDRLTNEKTTRSYKAVYVENEYVKALVLPEIGGRLHGATDKTNGYEFLYDQKVIKPGLISTTGAWISGGVEWNFSIGHRPSCFRDTDWQLTENSDGSKNAYQFYKGKALEALGEKKEARTIYEKMLTALEKNERPKQNVVDDPMIEKQRENNAEAIRLFTRTLALEGIGKSDESEKLRKEAIKMYPLVELGAYRPPRSDY